MTKADLNKDAIQSFLRIVYMGKISYQDAVISQENVFQSLAGYQMVPLNWVRAAFLLPQKYRNAEGKWCKYTVDDARILVHHYLGDLFDVRVEPNRYGTSQLYLSRKFKTIEAIKDKYPELFKCNEEEGKKYSSYVKRSNKTKSKSNGYDLYLAQEDTLVSLVENNKVPHSLYPSSSSISTREWLLLHTTFNDNRVFHPFTNLKKSQRNKALTHETDLHASQIVFLSNLIKKEAGPSPFTRQIDECLRTGKDVYSHLAKEVGKERKETKRELFKTLFGVRDSWIQKDEGYIKMMNKLVSSDDFKQYHKLNYARFEKAHPSLREASKIKKFVKLYMRTKLTAMELEVITDFAHSCKQDFVSIHDCLAFTSKQTRATVVLAHQIEKKYNVRLSHKEAVRTTYKAYEHSYLGCDVDLGTTLVLTAS